MLNKQFVTTNSEADSPLTKQAKWLSRYQFGLRLSEQGTVVSLGDGIAWISGLPSACMDEVLQLEDGSRALVFHLAKTDSAQYYYAKLRD